MERKWKRIWARNYCLLLSYYYANAFNIKNPIGISRNKLYIPEGNLHASYFDEKEFEQLINNFLAITLNTDMGQYAKQNEQKFSDAIEFINNLVSDNPTALSDNQIINNLEKLDKFFVNFTDWQYESFLALEGPGRITEEYVKKNYPNSAEILGWITTIYKQTEINKARIDLLKLAQSAYSQNDINNYLAKYSWTKVADLRDKPLSKDDLQKEIDSILDPKKELEEMESNRFESLNNYKLFIDKVSDTKLKKYIEIIHYFSYLKEMRDDYRRRVYVLIIPLITEVGKRIGLSFDQVVYLSIPEIISYLKRGINADSEIARKRKNVYSITIIGGKVTIHNKDVSSDFISDSLTNVSEVKGQPTYPGKVNGIARIINRPSEFNKFNKGEILITVMTHPEYLPIMKIAKAFVTDEGGITCHAAIVSRELGIPCIIGTKIATKVFKDGDKIEVNANHNWVRKIK